MNEAAAPTSLRSRIAKLRHGAWLGIVILVLATLGTCSPRHSSLDEIRKVGVLRVATVNSPTVYYLGPSGDPIGFEYDLVKALATHLGVRVELVVAATPAAAVDLVRSGAVHLAAASIAATPERAAQVRFSTPLQQVSQQLVYRAGQAVPKNLGDLQGSLRVVKDSAQEEYLQNLKAHDYPQLRWDSTEEDSAEELLDQVSQGSLDYTIVNSDLLALNLRYYPKLRVGSVIAPPQDIVWAFPRSSDDELLREANAMLSAMGGAEIARIKDRYQGHIDQVDTFTSQTLVTHADTRLPRYREAFEKAAAKYQLDWVLLAAIGYQESRWDPAAISPTGVRGIMQLTSNTADMMNLNDREDPVQSIWGGARFFRMLVDQLPDSIPEPDRSWMALAAYNMGIGHLFDARELTRKRGGDPNRWLDVRNSLPLLSKVQWYSKAQHGYARSLQAIMYVSNIRGYYDLLIWLNSDRSAPQPEVETDLSAEPTPGTEEHPLNINSPLL